MGQTKKTNVISRVSAYIFGYKLLFGGTLALACLMTILSVVAPSVIQRVLDNVFVQGLGDGRFAHSGNSINRHYFFRKRTA